MSRVAAFVPRLHRSALRSADGVKVKGMALVRSQSIRNHERYHEKVVQVRSKDLQVLSSEALIEGQVRGAGGVEGSAACSRRT